MSRRPQILVGVAAGLGIVVCLALLVYFRRVQARDYIQPYTVHTAGGTNYVVRLEQIAVGKRDKGVVVIASLRIENPNPVELALQRDWFILAAQSRDYYLPTAQGPEAPWIRVAAKGTLEKALLTFVLPDDALAGVLMLKIGQDSWIVLKNEKPFQEQLRDGEFRIFHQDNW